MVKPSHSNLVPRALSPLPPAPARVGAGGSGDKALGTRLHLTGDQKDTEWISVRNSEILWIYM